MRAVIQRVSKASVTIKGQRVSSMGNGLLVLLGIEGADTQEDVMWLSKKISQLRIFNDDSGMTNLSVKDIGGEVIVVSQFTLLAKTKKGNRPSYIKAAIPEIAIPLYKQFVKEMETLLGKKVETGEFGAMMQVSLINDGPVTIFIDTKNKG